ncbi:MAG TPA: universal stress protein [Phycisphaerae bacterium]|nr:universal stress protein [Phycisphaerae bacterium]
MAASTIADPAPRPNSPPAAAPAPELPYRRILAAVDREDHPALRTAGTLAAALGATLGIVHVVDITPLAAWDAPYSTREVSLKLLRDAGEQLMEHLRPRLPPGVPVEFFSREGCPADEILAAARKFHADLIVLGTHRRGPIAQFFLGSTSEALVHDGSFPVLLAADDKPPAPREGHRPHA